METQPLVVAMAELMQMLRLSRRRIATLTKEPGFPEPVAVLTVGRVWRYDDVRDYCEAAGRPVYPIDAVQ